MEKENRDYVPIHFLKWLDSPTGQREWNTFVRWAEPAKVFELVRDATRRINNIAETQKAVLDKVFPQTEKVPNPCCSD
jgi:hypothetical protein